MLRNKVLKSNMVYWPAQILGYVFSLAKVLVIPKLLMPKEYGLMTVVLLIATYSKIASSGILSAFDREYPKMLSNDEYGKNKQLYRDSCFAFFLIINAVFSLGAIVFFYINYYKETLLLIVLVLVAIGMFLENINEFVVVVNRAHRDFRLVSINRVFGIITSACLLMLSTYLFGIYGAITSIFISNILMLYFFIRAKDRPWFRLSLAFVRPICLLGFSLFTVNLLSICIDTMDKIFVIKTCGLQATGVYSFASLVSRLVMLLFSSAVYVIYPFLLSEYAKDYNLQKIVNIYVKYGLIIFWITPIFLSCVFIFSNSFIPWYLPAYSSATNFMFFLFLGCFWVIFSQVNDTFLLVINKQMAVIRNQLIAILLAAILFLWCYTKSVDLYCVAAIYSIYVMVYGIISCLSFLRASRICLKSSTFLLVKFLAPFIILTSTCFVVGSHQKIISIFSQNQVLQVLIKILLILIISTSFILYLNKKSSVFQEVRDIVRQKWLNILRASSMKSG